jgi:hemolysin III
MTRTRSAGPEGDTAPRWRWIREPFNGLSHGFGAALSIAGLCVLLAAAWGKPWHVTGFVIYGASLILLYAASTLYHSLPVSPRRIGQLLVFDQVAIYLLIAGTYTPVCLVTLRGPWGWSLFGVAWGLALVGIVLRVAWRSAPAWLPWVFYLVMGWISLVALGPLCRSLPPVALMWLFLGGAIYTVGAILLFSRRPRLWPGVFSFHELWHLFVLGGSTCHFILMLQFVAPAH